LSKVSGLLVALHIIRAARNNQVMTTGIKIIAISSWPPVTVVLASSERFGFSSATSLDRNWALYVVRERCRRDNRAGGSKASYIYASTVSDERILDD
jgi:hypothetical protein